MRQIHNLPPYGYTVPRFIHYFIPTLIVIKITSQWEVNANNFLNPEFDKMISGCKVYIICDNVTCDNVIIG